VGRVSLPLYLERFFQEGSGRIGKANPPTFQNELSERIGLIRFNIIPIDDEGNIVEDGPILQEGFTVYVHNYTGFLRKPVEGKVCTGRLPIIVETWRIMDSLTRDWVEQEYVIVVVTKNYFGSRLIKVKPNKPFMNIEVRIRLSRKEEVSAYGLEKEAGPYILGKSSTYKTVKDDTTEEEIIRVKKYLIMLENERRCGLISEKAYYRLKQRLESVLAEILLEKKIREGKMGKMLEEAILSR